MTIRGHLLLVGCGKMGGAMLRGWLQRDVPPGDVTVVEPNMAPVADLAEKGVRFLDDGGRLPAEFKPAVVVVAVKPQMTDGALPVYRRFGAPETVFLSIAAGRTIAYFEHHLGARAAIVRSMPNTP